MNIMNSKKERIDTATGIIDRSQQKAAKVAGSMFLCLIFLYFAEQLITSHIGSVTAKRITELSIDLIYIACAVLLAVALYKALEPVNKKLAGIAMFWRLGESFIVVTMMIFNFEGKAYTVGFYISAILFSIGSLLFFYLFFKSKYIPETISVLGIFASVMVTLIGFAILIFPDRSGVIQLGWIPIFIAEISLGFWLLLKGLRPARQTQPNLINH